MPDGGRALSHSQNELLRFMFDRGEIRPADIADTLGVSRQCADERLTRLTAWGVVESRSTCATHCEYVYWISERGKRRVEAMAA